MEDGGLVNAVAAAAVCVIASLAVRTRARVKREAADGLGVAAAATPTAWPPSSGAVVCIGDVHGHVDKLRKLWGHLEKELGADGLAAATVVFLGDYVDRGPDSCGALEWMISLTAARAPGRTRFICGNHDFGMACFIDCLPGTVPPGYQLDSTTPPEYKSGYWPHKVEGGMHYIGRRWGGSGVYSADTTFESYGLRFDPASESSRKELMEAVPASHKDFLRLLEWIVDVPVQWGIGRVVCVHAGLEGSNRDVSAKEQIACLKARDVTGESIQIPTRPGRYAAFTGRYEVELLPPDLKGKALLISGHHGFRDISPGRIICDASGGTASGVLEAVILPQHVVVNHNGGRETIADTFMPPEPEAEPEPAPPRTKAATPRAPPVHMVLSDELAAFLEQTTMPKSQVITAVKKYIKEHTLLDPGTKEVRLDARLSRIFKKDKIKMNQVIKLLGAHLSKPPQ